MTDKEKELLHKINRLEVEVVDYRSELMVISHLINDGVPREVISEMIENCLGRWTVGK